MRRIRWSRTSLGLMLALCLIGTLGSNAGAAAPPAGTPPALDLRFGVAEANADPAVAAGAQVGWTRVAFFWNQIEPRPGVFSLSSVGNDAPLLALAHGGAGIVGVVEGAPAWAESTDPPRPGIEVAPAGLTLAWNDPGNTWGQFMYWLSRHYAGLINTWIIGNEISIRSGPYQTWGGTIPEFAQMLMVADQAVHAANPAGHVLAPAAPYWYTHGATTSALLSVLGALPGAAQHHDYIDGLTLNLYSPIPDNPVIFGTYERILASHGLSTLPIWLTEANMPPNSLAHPIGASPLQQASFVAEDLATSFAWVSRAELYKLEDRFLTTNPPYGLVAANGGQRLAFSAWQTFVSVMRGATWESQSIWTEVPGKTAPSTAAVVTWGAPDRLIQMVWDQGPDPTTATVPAVAPTATLINVLGAESAITPVNGSYQVNLLGAGIGPGQSAATPLGGEPYYIIQNVPLGADGTPTTWATDAPDGFPATPTDVWSPSAPVIVPPGPVSAVVNPAGDQVVINDGGTVHWVTDAGTGAAQLNDPIAAVVGRHQWVYVANAGNSDVLVYTRAGRLVTVIGGYGTAPGRLLGVSGIAVGPSGTVYVSNSGAETVDLYSPTGRWLGAWGGDGSGPGQLNGPSGLVMGPQGTVWVADTLNNRVAVFTADGRWLGSLPTADPTALSWGPEGSLDALDGLTGSWSVLPKAVRVVRSPRSR
jgi:hypothetical protein